MHTNVCTSEQQTSEDMSLGTTNKAGHAFVSAQAFDVVAMQPMFNLRAVDTLVDKQSLFLNKTLSKMKFEEILKITDSAIPQKLSFLLVMSYISTK